MKAKDATYGRSLDVLHSVALPSDFKEHTRYLLVCILAMAHISLLERSCSGVFTTVLAHNCTDSFTPLDIDITCTVSILTINT